MTHPDNSASVAKAVELLPCPFCGSEPIEVRPLKSDTPDRYWRCPRVGCAAQMWCGRCMHADGLMTHAWNRRVPSAPSPHAAQAGSNYTETADNAARRFAIKCGELEQALAEARTAVATLTRENDSLKLALAQRGDVEAMWERCAKVCDEIADECDSAARSAYHYDDAKLHDARNDVAQDCAAAIRALSPSAREGEAG